MPVGPASDVTPKAMRPPVQKASLSGVLLNGTLTAAGKLRQAVERRLRAVLGVCPMPLDADVHLVLCSFGRAGLAYIEADPAESDASTIVHVERASVTGGRNERRRGLVSGRVGCDGRQGTRSRSARGYEAYGRNVGVP